VVLLVSGNIYIWLETWRLWLVVQMLLARETRKRKRERKSHVFFLGNSDLQALVVGFYPMEKGNYCECLGYISWDGKRGGF